MNKYISIYDMTVLEDKVSHFELVVIPFLNSVW